MHDQFKGAWGAEFRTLIRQKKMPGVPAGAVGCRLEDAGIRGYRCSKTAGFSHSARCTPHKVLLDRGREGVIKASQAWKVYCKDRDSPQTDAVMFAQAKELLRAKKQ